MGTVGVSVRRHAGRYGQFYRVNTFKIGSTDHLGSPAAATDASGNLLWERREYPFGDMRVDTGVSGTERLFTGQVEDADADLYYFNARYLETGFGRFISPDTIVPNPSDPRDHNRYAYVRNNPLKYTDPSGRCYGPLRSRRNNQAGALVCGVGDQVTELAVDIADTANSVATSTAQSVASAAKSVPEKARSIALAAESAAYAFYDVTKEIGLNAVGLKDVYLTDNPAYPRFPYPTFETKDSGLNIFNTLVPDGARAITLPFGVVSKTNLNDDIGLATHEGVHWGESRLASFISPGGIVWWVAYGVETAAGMATGWQSWSDASKKTSFEQRAYQTEENFGY